MPKKKTKDYLVNLVMNLIPDENGMVMNKIDIDYNNIDDKEGAKVFIDLIFDEWIQTGLDLAKQTGANDDQLKAMLTNYVKICGQQMNLISKIGSDDGEGTPSQGA